MLSRERLVSALALEEADKETGGNGDKSNGGAVALCTSRPGSLETRNQTEIASFEAKSNATMYLDGSVPQVTENFQLFYITPCFFFI
jgi:hypothetical protein